MTYDRNTPILLIVFNRPDLTALVFESIKKVKPRKLYIAADGPRNENESQLCQETRNIVIEHIDWDCEIKTLFREQNLGCKDAVSQAITWFFENEEEGIVLEDDCVPCESFFGFCSQMLQKYRDDERVGHIAGSNFQQGNIRGNGSYYFSNLTHVWGWAGWRRVWKDYDVNMQQFPLIKEAGYIDQCKSHVPYKEHWLHCFEETYMGRINTWDYQYAFLNLIKGRVSVMPNVNLISNVGFRSDATHTITDHPFSELKTYEMDTIVHPANFIADVEADLFTQRIEYLGHQNTDPVRKKGLLSRTWKKIKSLWR